MFQLGQESQNYVIDSLRSFVNQLHSFAIPAPVGIQEPLDIRVHCIMYICW